MATGDDIWFEMDFGDGDWQELDPGDLESFEPYFQEELRKSLEAAAEKIATNLRGLFQEAIHEQPRKEGDGLKTVLMQALTREVWLTAEGVNMGVFQLEKVQAETTSSEYGTQGQRSLFDIMEEGYGPSDTYGFIYLETAMELATQALHISSLSEKQGEEFMRHVQKAFAGRHGLGIMVQLKAKLFFRIPEFGTALEHGVLPHAGWQGWHILDEVDGPDNAKQAANSGTPNWLLTLLEKAMIRAAKRLKR